MTWLRHLRFSGPVNKITRRLAAIVLIGFALTLFFGGLAARQLVLADGGDSQRANLLLAGGTLLAVCALIAAGLLRTRWGITLGWILMGLSALSTILLTPMAIVTVIFGALWGLALVQGASMEVMTKEWIAEHGNIHPDEQPPTTTPTERTVSGDSDPTEREDNT